MESISIRDTKTSPNNVNHFPKSQIYTGILQHHKVLIKFLKKLLNEKENILVFIFQIIVFVRKLSFLDDK